MPRRRRTPDRLCTVRIGFAASVDNWRRDPRATSILPVMTTDSTALASPLYTDDDMIRRIEHLLAPAGNPGQLWVMFLDADHRQIPVIAPFEGCPALPDPADVDGLTHLMREALADHVGGAGSVLLVRERLGGDTPTEQDHCWAAALTGGCARQHLDVAGIFLLTPMRVQPLAA